MKHSTLKQHAHELIPFLFRVMFGWYLVGVLLNLQFPGLVSDVLSLDWWLWLVIALGFTTLFLNKLKQ